MIERYSLPEMAAVWSEERRLALWQQIETLVAEAWAAEGVVPPEAAAAIAAASPVDPASWRAREAETRHDVAAFVDVLADSVGAHGRWVHYGLTSSDVLDTALGIQMKEATALLARRIVALLETVQHRAVEHRSTVMVGRTHGMWAEPTTFGHKLAGFGFELVRAYRRLETAGRTVSYGKVSGAVGNHATVPSTVEERITKQLGLNAEPAATQVVGRDRHAAFMTTLALIGATLERFATEIRHLQRSEVGEVAEPFAAAQKGSSAMPHKHNPILAENITGIARLLRGWSLAALEDVALWHERDISHSSVERIAIPDACLALDFALDRMTRIVEGLAVDTDRMRANLDAAGDIVFSHAALLALIRGGADRDEAYRLIQSESGDLRDTLGDRVPADTFTLDRYLAGARESVDHLARVTADWLREDRAGW